MTPVASVRPDRPGALDALVGRTPLVRLGRFEPRPGIEIYAKLESRNPGGSVKDRAALAIIRDAERRGALDAGRVLLDATSGNTGIAYAMLAAARGYRVRLCVPANVTIERRRLLAAYGADLVLTDPLAGSDGAIVEARRLHAAAPETYFYADQYANPANWRAHFDTTGLEILEQAGNRLTHFVAGLGTSGTFVGVARRLRAALPRATLVSIQPDAPLHGLEGLKHMASAIVPAIYDPGLADVDLPVATETAYALTRRLAREEGLTVGPSSGAALAGCLAVADGLRSAVIVTVFPDGGERYLSERFWDEPDEATDGDGAGLAVSFDVEAAIRRHAEADYPDECCGALLGPRAGLATGILALPNASETPRERRFLVGPAEYLRAEREAAARGLALVGFYHSHPDHPAEPSAVDLAHALPNLSYLIVPVRAGRAAASRSWRLHEDRSGFDEEPVRTPVS